MTFNQYHKYTDGVYQLLQDKHDAGKLEADKFRRLLNTLNSWFTQAQRYLPE